MKKEIKRQTIHFLGIILAFIVMGQEFISSIKLFAALVFFMIIFNWYYGKRYARRKSFKEAINGSWLLSKDQRKGIVKSADKFYDFEENLFNKILDKTGLRHGEEDPTVPPLYFFLSSLICLIFLGQEITVLAIITLAVGDSLAAIIGKRYGKHRLPWSPQKSAEGSLSFFISVFVVIFAFLHYFPQFAVVPPLLLTPCVAFFGALVETEPTFTDNFSIPLFTGAVLYLLTVII